MTQNRTGEKIRSIDDPFIGIIRLDKESYN